jgi:hypothetical protein
LTDPFFESRELRHLMVGEHKHRCEAGLSRTIEENDEEVKGDLTIEREG